MVRHRGGNRAKRERRDMKSWHPEERPRRHYEEPRRQRNADPLEEYERDEGDGRYE